MIAQVSGERQPIEMHLDEKDPMQFFREAEHFTDCINENKENKAGGSEGLTDLKLMAEIYKLCEKHA